MHGLQHKVKDLSDKKKFAVLLMDEMKKKVNLKHDQYNGELIGYVNLGNIDLNKVATSILVFLTRSIVNLFIFSVVNFEADCISASRMFRLLWKAIFVCEKSY